MVPIEKVEARSSVDIDDSCNNCCYGCWKTPAQTTRPERSSSIHEFAEHVEDVLKGHLEVTPNEIKVFSSIPPEQRDDGMWELTIERKDDGLKARRQESQARLQDAGKKV